MRWGLSDCARHKRNDARRLRLNEMAKALQRWHAWFAWHPVRTVDGWAWLEVVDRQLYDTGLGNGWRYRYG